MKMGEAEVKGEGGSKEWKERRKGGGKKGRQGKEDQRRAVEGGEDEMVKGKEGWSGQKLGIGRREGKVERKGFEERTDGYKRLCCMYYLLM